MGGGDKKLKLAMSWKILLPKCVAMAFSSHKTHTWNMQWFFLSRCLILGKTNYKKNIGLTLVRVMRVYYRICCS